MVFVGSAEVGLERIAASDAGKRRIEKLGLVHAIATCQDCGKQWTAKNAHGVGARHHQATGHTVHVEVGYAYIYSNKEACNEESD